MNKRLAGLLGSTLLLTTVALTGCVSYHNPGFSADWNQEEGLRISEEGDTNVSIGWDGIQAKEGDTNVSIGWNGITAKEGDTNVSIGWDGIRAKDGTNALHLGWDDIIINGEILDWEDYNWDEFYNWEEFYDWDDAFSDSSDVSIGKNGVHITDGNVQVDITKEQAKISQKENTLIIRHDAGKRLYGSERIRTMTDKITVDNPLNQIIIDDKGLTIQKPDSSKSYTWEDLSIEKDSNTIQIEKEEVTISNDAVTITISNDGTYNKTTS